MSQFENLAVVILAAGLGTRMKSEFPKVLHEAAGRPLVEHVIRAAQRLKPEKIIVVIGHGANLMRQRLAHTGVEFVEQKQQLGTGHALLQCQESLEGFKGQVMVLNGDGPLLRFESLKAFAGSQADDTGMSLMICEVENPFGLGRIIRLNDGSVSKIVEEKDASPQEKAMKEVNPGIYLFNSQVFKLAQKLNNQNAAGEYYITDLVDIYIKAGFKVNPFKIADEREVLGVNNRKQLAEIETILRWRIRDQWLLSGVTMIDPASVYIDDEVVLEPDTIIHPNVHLKGKTVIHRGVTIPPNVIIDNSSINTDRLITPFSVIKDLGPEESKA
ncbi:MAG: NTP transferase domain-containing protein [Deinococcales bacterium]